MKFTNTYPEDALDTQREWLATECEVVLGSTQNKKVCEVNKLLHRYGGVFSPQEKRSMMLRLSKK